MARTSLKQQALDRINGADSNLQDYFWLLEELLENISHPNPALSYCFQCIESGQRVALYALLMRKYRTDSQLAWNAIDRLDITRKNFPEFYKQLAGKSLGDELRGILKPAEEVRDKITHGKQAKASDVYRGIIICVEYAEAINEKFWDDVGFEPFGSLRGVTSSRRPQLDKDITRLIIRGLNLET